MMDGGGRMGQNGGHESETCDSEAMGLGGGGGWDAWDGGGGWDVGGWQMKRRCGRAAGGGNGRKRREMVLEFLMAVVFLFGAVRMAVRCVQKGWPVSVVDGTTAAVLAFFAVTTCIPAIAQMRKMRRKREE